MERQYSFHLSGVHSSQDFWGTMEKGLGGYSFSNLVRRAEETASGVGVWLRTQGVDTEIPLSELKEAHTSLQLGWNWILSLLFSFLLVWGYILRVAI